MKKLIGFAIILVALFLSNSVFAEGFTFEVNGKKYEAAEKDLLNKNGEPYFTWGEATKACLAPEFLPSKEMLKAMYEQLHKKGVGGFANYFYWNSTVSNDRPWFQDFSDGFQGYDLYSDIIEGGSPDVLVRCVRAL